MKINIVLIALVLLCYSNTRKVKRGDEPEEPPTIINKLEPSAIDEILKTLNNQRNELSRGTMYFQLKQNQIDQLNTLGSMELYTLNVESSGQKGTKMPPAIDMNEVEWDIHLEELAKDDLLDCKNKEVPKSINNKAGNFGYLSFREKYSSKPEKIDWKVIIEQQINSIIDSKFDLKTIDKYYDVGKKLSGFPILMYSKLEKIGCSSTICNKNKSNDENTEFEYKFSCFTSPQGPKVDEPIYTRPKERSSIGVLKCSSTKKNENFMYLCPSKGSLLADPNQKVAVIKRSDNNKKFTRKNKK